MKKLSVLFVVIALVLCLGCATAPVVVPDGCDNSIIYKNYVEFKGADALLKIANYTALRESVYTKKEALLTIGKLEDLVKRGGITYLEILTEANRLTAAINGDAGFVIFLISDEATEAFQQDISLDPCDRDLLLKHLARQRVVVSFGPD